MSSPPLSATARQKTQPTELTCVSIERLNDPLASALLSSHRMRYTASRRRCGRWVAVERASAPVLFARVPTRHLAFRPCLSSPSGTNSWPRQNLLWKRMRQQPHPAVVVMLSRSLGQAGTNPNSIPNQEEWQKKSASLWAFARCHSVATSSNYSRHEERLYSIFTKQCGAHAGFRTLCPKVCKAMALLS